MLTFKTTNDENAVFLKGNIEVLINEGSFQALYINTVASFAL